MSGRIGKVTCARVGGVRHISQLLARGCPSAVSEIRGRNIRRMEVNDIHLKVR